jgi:hypothetical protein
MKICAYCGRENSSEALQCHECGTAEFNPLSSATPSVPEPASGFEFVPLTAENMQEGLVTLMRCRTLLEADMIVSQLEAAGISAFVPDQFLMQAEAWHVNTYGFVRIQVSSNDHAAAKEFLTAPFTK